MKKHDVKLWLAIFLLIGLVLYLIFVSAKAGENRQNQIDKLRQILQSLPAPKDGQNGYTPVKGVDYFDGAQGIPGPQGNPGAQGATGSPGKDGSSCSTAQTDIGASLTCTDGTQATLLNGLDGQAGREQELSCVNGILKTRYKGDVFWKSTNITCGVVAP